MDALYHITWAGLVEAIQDIGLQPQHGYYSKFGPGVEEHSYGRVFLTGPDGVSFWHDRARIHWPIMDAEEVPVVLRVWLTDWQAAELYEDAPGIRHSGMPSFFIEGSVAPEQIELWDGSEWSPLLGVSMEELFEAIEQGLVVEEDEDGPGSWVYYDAQVLLPPEFGP